MYWYIYLVGAGEDDILYSRSIRSKSLSPALEENWEPVSKMLNAEEPLEITLDFFKLHMPWVRPDLLLDKLVEGEDHLLLKKFGVLVLAHIRKFADIVKMIPCEGDLALSSPKCVDVVENGSDAWSTDFFHRLQPWGIGDVDTNQGHHGANFFILLQSPDDSFHLVEVQGDGHWGSTGSRILLSSHLIFWSDENPLFQKKCRF